MNTDQPCTSIVTLTWEDLDAWAGARTVRRAKSYSASVTALYLTAEGGLLATVPGTRAYTTRVEPAEGGDLVCTCSCPYPYGPCKHGVAVILAALGVVEKGEKIPPASREDVRLAQLEQRDEPTEKDRGRGKPTTKAALTTYLAGLKKRDLRDVLKGLVEAVPEARQRLVDQMRLAKGNAVEMVNAARAEMAGRVDEDRLAEDYLYAGDLPDYDRVEDRLRELLDAGYPDEVVQLGTEVMRVADEQIAAHDRHGDVAWPIGRCMKVVFAALNRSQMAAATKLLWEVDARLRDNYCLLDDCRGPLAEPDAYPNEVWSEVADALAARLAGLPVAAGKGGTGTGALSYHRRELMGFALNALANADRADEIVSILEREASITQCYDQLVDRLIADGKLVEAKRWAEEGIRETAEERQGIAASLRKRLRTMAEAAGDLAGTAAYRAAELFRSPSLGCYISLHEDAVKAGVWNALRSLILKYLETGRRPDLASATAAWPLPAAELPLAEQGDTRGWLPRTDLLTEIALHEGRHDDAITLYSSRKREAWGHGLGDKVADTVQSTHPDAALALWCGQAERWIAQVNVSSYDRAAAYLERMRDLYQRLGREDEWRAQLVRLRAANSRRPRMLQVLDRVEGKRRRILSGKGRR
jgi:uncharacterized Zn finger protein